VPARSPARLLAGVGRGQGAVACLRPNSLAPSGCLVPTWRAQRSHAGRRAAGGLQGWGAQQSSPLPPLPSDLRTPSASRALGTGLFVFNQFGGLCLNVRGSRAVGCLLQADSFHVHLVTSKTERGTRGPREAMTFFSLSASLQEAMHFLWLL